jgi:anaerobic selenocysteine-containing dehydrogenase
LREDLFVVVHEQFMTDTAKLADIVLPATMFLEHNDYYTRSGHTRVLFGPKLIEAPGEAKPNFWVINELLTRLGTTEDPAMQMTDRQVVAATLKSSGYGDLDEIEAHGGFVERARPDDQQRFAERLRLARRSLPLPPQLAGHRRQEGLYLGLRSGRDA